MIKLMSILDLKKFIRYNITYITEKTMKNIILFLKKILIK